MYILFLRTEPPSTAIQWELEENRPGLRALVRDFLSDSSSICVKAVHKPTNKVRRDIVEMLGDALHLSVRCILNYDFY